jgi:elongation factor P--(R)-beta-lysine ligase
MSQEPKTNWQPSASIEALKLRARMLQSMRAFFADKQVLEVETPILSTAAITDPHLQSFSTEFQNAKLFLNTSPEFFMKRLLAAGSGDIFQICKVFRDDEQGSRHNPEFSMLEWYRTGFDHHRLMDEIEQLIQYLMAQLNVEIKTQVITRISYRQAFINALGIDPLIANMAEIKSVAEKNHIDIPIGMDVNDKDMWLDWLITQSVAPSFNQNEFTFLFDYPASQAALAKLSEQDSQVAHRFELFYGELELANGFYELTDARELRNRFENENAYRSRQGIELVPVDELLLAALESGLPDCAGVAIGLDRLLMVLSNDKNISKVLSFDFNKI